MLKPQNKSEKGFTIIEVMIVLAIAGLILLIVFLAVPALQRNSRNTQRKNDVAGLLGAITEFSTNNGGATVAAGNLATILPLAHFGFYTATVGGGQGQVELSGSATNAALPLTAANDRVRLAAGAQCGAGGVTAPGSQRQVAAQYLVEINGGGYQATCQDS